MFPAAPGPRPPLVCSRRMRDFREVMAFNCQAVPELDTIYPHLETGWEVGRNLRLAGGHGGEGSLGVTGGWAGPWVHGVMGVGGRDPGPSVHGVTGWGLGRSLGARGHGGLGGSLTALGRRHSAPLPLDPTAPPRCLLPSPSRSQAHKLTSSQAGTVCKCQRGGAGFPTDGDVSLRQPGGCPDLPGLRPSPVYARPPWRPAPARTGHGWFGSGNFLQISVTPWDLTINPFWTAGSHVWLFTYLFT